jgi:hypothetical protein
MLEEKLNPSAPFSSEEKGKGMSSHYDAIINNSASSGLGK